MNNYVQQNQLSPLNLPTTTIGEIKIAAISMQGLVDQMEIDCLEARSQSHTTARTIFDANGQGLSLYANNKSFAKSLDQGDVIHADGGFLVTLSKFKNGPTIPERTATTDLVWEAAERAAEKGLSFFLLGGELGLAERARDQLVKAYPDLKIVGCHHGFFSQKDEAKLVDKINKSGADIVWVGLGKPREQQFCVTHKASLNVGWLITCGGCFNFITGDYVRAPKWMQNAGIEWLHRMASRPRELFFRYLVTNPHSLYLALTR